jgi:hypothetical protein
MAIFLPFFDKEIGNFLEFIFPSVNSTTFFKKNFLRISRIFYIKKIQKKKNTCGEEFLGLT